MHKKQLLWILIIPAVCSPLIHYRMQQKVEDDYKTCRHIQKNMATALEMFSTDYEGRYPHKLTQLVPVYLKEMPVCPGADPATHRYGYQYAIKPDLFSIYCEGLNHQPKIAAPNYPHYFNGYGICEP